MKLLKEESKRMKLVGGLDGENNQSMLKLFQEDD